MKTRELGAIALALLSVNVMSLPSAVEALADSLGPLARHAEENCGCSALSPPGGLEAPAAFAPGSAFGSNRLGQAINGNVGTSGSGSLDPDPPPTCPTTCGSPQEWSWYECLKVNPQPLDCQLWRMKFIRYFCPGENFHCCYGIWHYYSGNCSDRGLTCNSGSSSELPTGCTPPVTPSTLCAGCAPPPPP